MNKQLLEIEPKELKFEFILKKQCSCSLTLTNNTDQYVAFKVKTTSPKKYCVRPNVGIIQPKSAFDFTVTMQAQREAPPDMICKDKFLIQSTVVPEGTSDEDITSATVSDFLLCLCCSIFCDFRSFFAWQFVKDSGRYIEENKLKVALLSPPHSPVLSPINGTTNPGINYEASIPKEPVFSRIGVLGPLETVAEVEESKMITFEDLKAKKDVEWKPRKDMFYDEDLKPKKDAGLKPRNDVINVDLKSEDTQLNPKNNFVNGMEFKPVKDVESKPTEDNLDTEELKSVKEKEFGSLKDNPDTDELKSVKEKEFSALKDGELKTMRTVEELKFAKDLEEMKSKLNDLETKLGKAEAIISKLTEERRVCTQERKILQEELALLRKNTSLRRVQVGFPLLFVCMVALVGVLLGYILCQ
ncbi:hypothetical protein PTKIN_Ptkin06aG0162900 [Pterospermum kingtungense]